MFHLMFCLCCVCRCFTSCATHPDRTSRPAVVRCCAAAGSEPVYDLLDRLTVTPKPWDDENIYKILSQNYEAFVAIVNSFLPPSEQLTATTPVLQGYKKLRIIVDKLKESINLTNLSDDNSSHKSHSQVDLEFTEQIPLLVYLAHAGDKEYVMEVIEQNPTLFMNTLVNDYAVPETNQEITVDSCYEALTGLEIEEEY